MKKLRYVWLFLILCVALFTASGCGRKGKEAEGTGTREVRETTERLLSDRNKLPEDGVVTKEEIASIAGMDGTVEFFGETPEGNAYTWIYLPKSIRNPQEQRLKVACVTDDLKKIRKKAKKVKTGDSGVTEQTERKPEYALGVTLEKFYLAADARLSLTLTEKWETESVCFYKDTEKGLQELSEAEVSEEGGKMTLSVQLSEVGDTYYLIGWADVSSKESSKAKKESTGNKTQAGESQEEGSTEAVETSEVVVVPEGTADGSSGTAATSGSPKKKPAKAPETTAVETEPDAPEPACTCTISIECSTILSNWDSLKESKAPYVPGDGWILNSQTVEFTPGETVYDILVRVCGQYGIHMESAYTPAYGSYYVEGINQIYEFDCGSNSGWMFRVNGWYPNYGCSSYQVEDGDRIEWKYTCNLGSDIGGGF